MTGKTVKLGAKSTRTTPPEGVTLKDSSLEQLAATTGKSVETLRLFAKISDQRNAHLFTAEAARIAFKKR